MGERDDTSPYCSVCGITMEALQSAGRNLYYCDRCGVGVCSDCSANSDDGGVTCEEHATAAEWRRG